MKKASRSIVYKEEESIIFFLGKGETLERDFLLKIRRCPFMENFDNDYDIVLRIFNNACYICTLVYQTDCPLLDLKEYERIATDGHDDIIWTNHIFMATMALVVKWLRSEESKTIMTKRGRQKDIEDLCAEICVSIENRCSLTDDVIDDFHTLISNKVCLPSGFIDERQFQRRSLAETVEDKSVKPNDILDSSSYIANLITNPDEFKAAFGPDSYFAKEAPKLQFEDTKMLRELWLYLGKKINEDKKEYSVRKEAFDTQASSSYFTTRQIAIIAYALCKKGNVIPNNKKNIAFLFNKLTGHSSNRIGQNLCSRYSDEEIEEIAVTIENDMPEFANYLREKTFFLPEMKK